MLVGSLLIGRAIRWLVGGRRSGLSRAGSIRRVARMASGRRRRFAGRRLLDHRARSRSGRLDASSAARLPPRLSGMRCQSLLLFCKRHRRRRRRPLCDHLPVHYCRGRRGHVIRGGSLRSEHALACGSHRDPRELTVQRRFAARSRRPPRGPRAARRRRRVAEPPSPHLVHSGSRTSRS
jgi:hypothetical protein